MYTRTCFPFILPCIKCIYLFFISAAGIERDAVSIFTKYVSPDASRPIPITEQIRNDIVGRKESLVLYIIFLPASCYQE